MLIFALG